MHSRKRGKSGSTKPEKKTKPAWVTYKPKDVEMLVAKLGKEGKTPSTIGLMLRDTYGIPDVKSLCGSSIVKILENKKLGLELPEDLNSLIKRLAALQKHLDNNHNDQFGKRGKLLTQSLINRLVKYYKRTGKLDEGWKLDMTRLGYYSE